MLTALIAVWTWANNGSSGWNTFYIKGMEGNYVTLLEHIYYMQCSGRGRRKGRAESTYKDGVDGIVPRETHSSIISLSLLGKVTNPKRKMIKLPDSSSRYSDRKRHFEE